MKKHGLKHLVRTGKINGTRIALSTDSITNWMEKGTPVQVLHCVRNRETWRTMIINASRLDTLEEDV